jgi:hypothetical protein
MPPEKLHWRRFHFVPQLGLQLQDVLWAGAERAVVQEHLSRRQGPVMA